MVNHKCFSLVDVLHRLHCMSYRYNCGISKWRWVDGISRILSFDISAFCRLHKITFFSQFYSVFNNFHRQKQPTFKGMFAKKSINVSKKRSSATAEKQRVSCPHGGGLGPPAHSPSAPSGYTYAYGRIRKPQRTYAKRAVRKVHFKMNRAFKVIPIGAGRNP